MKQNSKIISILLVIILTLTLIAGCSSGKDSTYSGRENSMLNTYSHPPQSNSQNVPAYMPPPSQAYPYEIAPDEDWRYEPFDETEEYAFASESPFKDVRTSPLSTFSADVDTASYSNMRRQLSQNRIPTGVRIEELINYFDYSYRAPRPGDAHPFSITTEIGVCPWAPGHLLAMVGIQGAQLQNTEEIANNIVFLIDVSGSMNPQNRLPLAKQSMILLLDQLNENDVISIVTYAGSDRIVADSVRGSEKRELTRLINSLGSGGSTAGARGLSTAYELASKNFIEGGNNRIILATDGDFNVGISSVEAMINMIETERQRGVFISVLGFGMDNLKDNMMKAIAANGNGNYAYIDTIQEARKVLVDEFDSTMFTIAKDVKIQIEFNPETVSAYRLIGYDTRRLENEDFNDDMKDAGDIGSGHNVTAFYELIPVGSEENDGSVDPLRYSYSVTTGSDDFMTVKVRYKDPDGYDSKLVEQVVGPNALRRRNSDNFVFASAVAEFGLIVTDSAYAGNSSLNEVLSRAGDSLGADYYGLRAEFIELVNRYGQITNW